MNRSPSHMAVVLLALGTSVSPCLAQNLPDGAPAGIESIRARDLGGHAALLASDALGGRYTGSAGQMMAAKYIAGHFDALGLEPMGDEGEGRRSFFQRYPVERTWLVPDTSGLRIGEDTWLRQGFGVLPGQLEGERLEVEGEFLFVGNGHPRNLPESGLEKTLPVVALPDGNAAATDVMGAFMGGMRVMGRARAIAARAEKAGAAAMVFCLASDDGGMTDVISQMTGLTPDKHSLSFGAASSGQDLGAMMGQGGIPMVFLGREAGDRLLEHLKVDRKGEAGARAPGALALEVGKDEDFRAVNVCGLIRGSDPELAGEAVVFSAHMDHVGTRLDGDAFNGADDNASGSAALLELAEAFAVAPRPRRTVIFLSVSGEELGLWGSKYYSDNPTWPAEQIIANINIDMIGRIADLSGPSEISITPSYQHPKYSSIGRRSAQIAELLGIGLTIGDTYYERSDHYNFAEKGIPVVFFCDGEHEDYHRVSDHADKLDTAKMERVTRLAFWTGVDVANGDERPEEIGRHRGWLGARR